MPDGVEISSNAATILRRFAHLPLEVRGAVRKGLARALLLIEDRVRSNTRIRPRHGASGLLGRLTSHVKVGGPLGIDGVIGFRKTAGFPYEYAQEFGAHARKGRAMAIPITAEARRAGSPRKMEGLFRPKGTNVLVRTITRGQRELRSELHWVLVAAIPPRLRFRETVLSSLGLVSREVEAAGKDAI